MGPDLAALGFIGIIGLALVVLFVMALADNPKGPADDADEIGWKGEVCTTHVCPNHGTLFMHEVDEGGACLVCKGFYLVVPIKKD